MFQLSFHGNFGTKHSQDKVAIQQQPEVGISSDLSVTTLKEGLRTFFFVACFLSFKDQGEFAVYYYTTFPQQRRFQRRGIPGSLAPTNILLLLLSLILGKMTVLPSFLFLLYFGKSIAANTWAGTNTYSTNNCAPGTLTTTTAFPLDQCLLAMSTSGTQQDYNFNCASECFIFVQNLSLCFIICLVQITIW